ncbi:MAG TPA: energy transducer TonB [Acidobacteriaceae bacterium]|jgi:protein TonB|nr:energy transducer TonB [Acidobacteriaceae bacterium]
MFEGSLIESRGLAITRTQQWTTLGSITLQCTLAGLLIAFPLMRPQTLLTLMDAPHLSLPLLQKPVVEQVQRTKVAGSSAAISAPVATPAAAAAAAHPFIFLLNSGPSNDLAPSFDPTLHMTQTDLGPLGIASLIGVVTGPGVTVERAPPSAPLHISAGVSMGLLLTPIQPVYPAIARAARVQGEVVVEAVISDTGRIESLHAISGPQMLRAAALTAVEVARYRPYLLNGEPIKVKTTITVIFQLGS